MFYRLEITAFNTEAEVHQTTISIILIIVSMLNKTGVLIYFQRVHYHHYSLLSQ